MSKIPLYKKQDINAPNAIIQLRKTYMCDLSSDVNNTSKTNTTRLKDPSIN